MTETLDRPTESHTFQAEVSRLLHLMVHSVYSNRDIFLRELISNAADACEKLRYLALETPALLGDDGDDIRSRHGQPPPMSANRPNDATFPPRRR